MAKYQRTQGRSTNWRNEPATDAQYKMIERIASEHIVPLAILDEYERQKGLGKITKSGASAWMEIFKQADPLPLTDEQQPASEPGLYEIDGTRYEAKLNRKTGRLNVFHAETGEYAKGIAPQLKAGHRLAEVSA